MTRTTLSAIPTLDRGPLDITEGQGRDQGLSPSVTEEDVGRLVIVVVAVVAGGAAFPAQDMVQVLTNAEVARKGRFPLADGQEERSQHLGDRGLTVTSRGAWRTGRGG